MLLEVFIILKKDSSVIVHQSFTNEKFQVDPALFGGIISAISAFTSEIKIGQIKTFETGSFRVSLSPFEGIIVVGIVEKKKEELFTYQALESIASQFWNRFQKEIFNLDKTKCEAFTEQIDRIVFTEFEKIYISENYPKNLIRIIIFVREKLKKQILRFIGYKTGKSRTTPLKNIDALNKKIHKELDMFCINKSEKISDNKIIIKVPMCPICRKIRSKDFSCEFLSGFIEGIAKKVIPTRNIRVSETSCIAHGDKACIFNLQLK